MLHVSGRTEEYNSDDTMCDSSSTSTQDIKNVRLACHTLSTTASRYLIERITVEMSLSSLSRFEKVCNHPLIRHGVRAVQICLAQYDDVFDNNLEGFILYHKRELERLWSTPMGRNRMDEIRLVSRTWGNYLDNLVAQRYNLPHRSSFDRLEVGRIRALMEGYRLYQCGLQEQKALQNGGFVARVSASMVKLPVAKHLELTDWDTVRWGQTLALGSVYGHCTDISSNESIVHSLAHGRSPFSNIQGTKLLHLVPKLICGNITSLDIRISPTTRDYTELSLLGLQENQLKSNLRKLQSFRFENYGVTSDYPAMDLPGFRPLARFLDACLESESLEHLFVGTFLLESSPKGSLINPRAWPRLKSAVLRNLPASEADLDVLTKSIASHSDGSLTLDFVHLYGGGTWANVLNMLRERRIRVVLGCQCGAEFDANPHMEVFAHNLRTPINDFIPPFAEFDVRRETMSFRLLRGFGELRVRETEPIRFLPSFAEYYVGGEDMPNPILNPPDQELRDRLLGTVPDNDGDPDVEGYDHEAGGEDAVA